MMRASWLIAIACGVGLVGCGGSGDPTGEDGSTLAQNASVALSLEVSPDFQGNSVLICGDRKYDADAKYSCVNTVYPCKCFDFESDGTLKAEYGKEAKIDDLCPSDNVPEADWVFEYKIFSERGCYGDVLNTKDNDHNFVCFDDQDIYEQRHPNKSVEHLNPGKNENHIICLTKDASKTFDFNVCVDETTYLDEKYDTIRLDCGCYFDEYTQMCECDQDLGELPDECWTDSYSCEILCGPASTK